jgi:hypothetical protein
MNSENETNPADEQLSNPPSLGDSEEEYLRSTWDKLGVGQDGYLDQTQLALVCECIGMEKLSDEVIFNSTLAFFIMCSVHTVDFNGFSFCIGNRSVI